MRANEMTAEQKQRALSRAERADSILADYHRQYEFELPAPWQEAVRKLLLTGLSDPGLHTIFEAYARTEFEAGRMEEKPFDAKQFAEDVAWPGK